MRWVTLSTLTVPTLALALSARAQTSAPPVNVHPVPAVPGASPSDPTTLPVISPSGVLLDGEALATYVDATERIEDAKSLRLVTRASDTDATVYAVIEFPADPCKPPTRMRIESRAPDGTPIETLVYASDTSLIVDHAVRRFAFADGIALDGIPNAFASVPIWYLHARCPTSGFGHSALVSAQHEGECRVGGTICDALELRSTIGSWRMTIARSDNLPRSFATHPDRPLRSNASAIEVREVIVDSKLDSSEFLLTPPAGYALVPSNAIGAPSKGRESLCIVGKLAPEISLQAADGEEIPVASFQGGVLLLAFGTFHGTRDAEFLNEVKNLAGAFQAGTLTVRAVECELTDANEIARAARERGWTLPVLRADSAAKAAFRARSGRMIVVIGADGRVLAATGTIVPESLAALHHIVLKAARQ